MMKKTWLPVLAVVLALSGCAGLQQFPAIPEDIPTVLDARDKEFTKVLEAIKKEGNPDKKKSIRNEEIDKRLRVIDINFRDFEMKLAKENVWVDFGVAVAQVGVGGGGALVSESASQILSAVSGGMAGAQQAYGKAALFDRAMPALLAQMIASRKDILVLIYEGRRRSIEEYPLSNAVRDIEGYYFAGSLPGAVVATSADAKVKNDKAEALLFPKITKAAVTEKAFTDRQKITQAIAGLGVAKAKALITKIEAAFPVVASFIALQYPNDVRVADTDGKKAIKLLGRLVPLTAKEPEDRTKWQAAINSL